MDLLTREEFGLVGFLEAIPEQIRAYVWVCYVRHPAALQGKNTFLFIFSFCIAIDWDIFYSSPNKKENLETMRHIKIHFYINIQ